MGKKKKSSTRVSQRAVPASQRLHVVGRVRGAKMGKVTVKVQRRVGKHWKRVAVRSVAVRNSGRFRTPLRLRCRGKSKLWRLRAQYSGSSHSKRSRASIRRFRFCAQ